MEATTAPAAGRLFAIGAAAVVAAGALHVAAGPAATGDRAARPPAAEERPRVLRAPGAVVGPDAGRAAARPVGLARAFARDWLDYLGGRRAVSTVRGASPELRLTFAGGAPSALPTSDSGLRSVACAPEAARGLVCAATAAGLGRFRFAMAPAEGGGLEVSEVELD